MTDDGGTGRLDGAGAGAGGGGHAGANGRQGAGMEITARDRARMNSKIRQFIRFVILNLKILKGVDASKRS